MNPAEPGALAGRYCPTDYRLTPSLFRAAPLIEADVLYVVGGLYGNLAALSCLEAIAAAESTAPVLVFNGDFHWFDIDPTQFEAVDAGARRHVRLRGNVETELARDTDEAGCGCAYPPNVPDADVDRSNSILTELKSTARILGLAESLGRLPMVARAKVGGAGVLITHGDDQSLAGWSLGADRVDASWRSGLSQRLQQLEARVIASSHTCLPVARVYGSPQGLSYASINNGAAGMANFRDDPRGLVTRIARANAGQSPVAPIYGADLGELRIEAIPLAFDMSSWLESFSRQWPANSAAAVSYLERIRLGPAYDVSAAAGAGFERLARNRESASADT
ncbi:MAG: hypothetical protein H6934_00200 [Burkholderiaceae bacterium]|nr:hypothetical protein [Burkholderiaceae bacterium]